MLSTHLKTSPKELKPYRLFNGRIDGELYQKEALLFLRSLSSDSADLIFLDPPFNLGKEYSPVKASDRLLDEDYRTWMIDVLKESTRILNNGGTLYLYHLPIWAMRFGAFLEATLTFRHWIAVSMKSGFVRGKRLYPAHYALLYFTKGDPTSFNRPKLSPVRCRKCKKTVKDYGGYRSIIESQGINLSDFWEDISPVRHANRKFRASNELPPKLTERVLQISGRRGGLFVDPFAGSGTAVLSAVRAGMSFKACDILRSNCRLLEQRLASYTLENDACE